MYIAWLQVEQLAVVASPGECARHRVSKLWIDDLQADQLSVIQVSGKCSWNLATSYLCMSKPRENSDGFLMCPVNPLT